MSIRTPSLAYEEMREGWKLPLALWKDTQGMREANVAFLPALEGEKDENGNLNDKYYRRLNETFLTNYFRSTIKDLSSKIFEKPIVIGEELEPYRDWFNNIDMMGSNLNDFAVDLFEGSAKLGISYILVDAPNDEGAANLAEQRAKNLRPYFTHVTGDQVIGWKTESVNNVETLIEARIVEQIIEEDEEYKQSTIEQVRRLFIDNGLVYFEIYQEDKDREWVVVEEGQMSCSIIPLIPVYTNRTGFMQAETYFTTLCWLNLAHWQTSSYQRHILNTARVPRMSAVGFTVDEVEYFKKHGVAHGIMSTNENAKAAWVEANGSSISHGVEDETRLEEEMQRRSLNPVLKTATASDVATIANLEENKTNSVLQAWAESSQRSIGQAIYVMLEMAGEPMDELTVKVNDEFSIVSDVPAVAKQLLEEHLSGVLSIDELLKEYKRIGHRDDEFDIEVEKELLSKGAAEFGGDDG